MLWHPVFIKWDSFENLKRFLMLEESEVDELYNLCERQKYLAECPKPVLRGYLNVTNMSKAPRAYKKWLVLCGSFLNIYPSHSDLKSELSAPLHLLEFDA